MSSLLNEQEIISLAECLNTKLHYVLQQCEGENGNEVVFRQKKLQALSNWRRERLSGSLPQLVFCTLTGSI